VSEHALRVCTIGHSNHDSDHVVGLLERHEIEAIVDVRSSPWSRFAPQFNRETLERTLSRHRIGYVFLGAELGGRPDGDDFYDEDGHVLYSEVAETDFFRAGIEQLVEEARGRRVAMMCSEEDPADCHRRLLVTRVLRDSGVQVDHIRGDGSIQSEDELANAEPQQSLFAEEKPWRSTRSVSHRRPRATSSAD
jgi:uncharacterized protein (DUF488 family)